MIIHFQSPHYHVFIENRQLFKVKMQTSESIQCLINILQIAWCVVSFPWNFAESEKNAIFSLLEKKNAYYLPTYKDIIAWCQVCAWRSFFLLINEKYFQSLFTKKLRNKIYYIVSYPVRQVGFILRRITVLDYLIHNHKHNLMVSLSLKKNPVAPESSLQYESRNSHHGTHFWQGKSVLWHYSCWQRVVLWYTQHPKS